MCCRLNAPQGRWSKGSISLRSACEVYFKLRTAGDSTPSAGVGEAAPSCAAARGVRQFAGTPSPPQVSPLREEETENKHPATVQEQGGRRVLLELFL